MRARLIRVLRITFGAALCLLVGLVGFVQVQQRVFHHHVVKLMADAQSIELHKSTWPDAQRMMRSWGKWGYEQGACSPSDCKLVVLVDDQISRTVTSGPAWVGSALGRLRFDSVLARMGSRMGYVQVTFYVRDGLVVRMETDAILQVPRFVSTPDDTYAFMVGTSSVQRVMQWVDYNERDEVFAKHPNYTALRRSGMLMVGRLLYSHLTPQDEVRKITTYDLDCYLPASRCALPGDLIPAIEPYHFYRETATTPSPHPCRIPAWARTRDASQVLLVRAGSSTAFPQTPTTEPRVDATVEVLRELKGAGLYQAGASVVVNPFTSEVFYGEEPSEEFLSGREYILFSYAFAPYKPATGETFQLTRCSVLAASEEALREVEHGLSLTDKSGIGYN